MLVLVSVIMAEISRADPLKEKKVIKISSVHYESAVQKPLNEYKDRSRDYEGLSVYTYELE